MYNTLGTPIDATNFINDAGASFDITFPELMGENLIGDLYEGWNYTQNYVNNGEMSCNTGFRFDTVINGHTGALNFDNSGIINCGLGSGTEFTSQYVDYQIVIGGYSGIYVLATNIVDSGSINTGEASLMRFVGGNVDLTDGTLNMATTSPFFSSFSDFFFAAADLNVSAVSSGYGVNTNGWDPAFELLTNSVSTSVPFAFTINNATPYINVVSNYNGGSNTLIQAVMLRNERPGSSASVFFIPGGPGDSFVAIQWGGGYVDPLGNTLASNYLALIDDLTLATSTNALVPTNVVNFFYNLIPANYSFIASNQPPFLSFAATPSGLPTGFAFAPSFVTNTYSYVDALLLPTSVPTNLVPGGTLTNIAGRVEINASETLNLSGASISGMNFLSLRATNQVDNDGLAHIYSPFTDIFFGMTNGNMVFTNILISQLPQWNGNIQAWTGGWQLANADGTTNIYQVLVVDAAISPVSLAQQQDVYLYTSNNLVLSDSLNVLRNFYTTATNLVLTTNTPGEGALSFDGELNFNMPLFSWPIATPDLRVLTNNGVITLPNVGTFGSAAVPYLSFMNNGTVKTVGATTIHAGDFQNSGSFSAGGSFDVYAGTAILTNGTITATASMILSGDTLVISNQYLSIGQGLTLAGTTLLTDTGVTNGNNWSIGTNYVGYGGVPGLSLVSKPLGGDLLGTTIYESSPGANLTNEWAGIDYGVSNNGFTNNEAIGRLILDSTTNVTHFGKYTFTGASVSNAVYIDYLEFVDAATNGVNNSYEFTPWMKINTNIVVYFAQAVAMGVSIAEKLDNASLAGANGGLPGKYPGRLRWIPSYAGYFSGTNIVYPGGITNRVNAALAQSTLLDSDGNGVVNANDPTPFFTASEVDLNVQVTNLPPLTTLISWHSIPASTNIVYYTTDIGSTNWLVLTNFVSPPTVPPVGGWPITNLVAEPVNLVQPHYYRIAVTPNNQLLYGN